MCLHLYTLKLELIETPLLCNYCVLLEYIRIRIYISCDLGQYYLEKRRRKSVHCVISFPSAYQLSVTTYETINDGLSSFTFTKAILLYNFTTIGNAKSFHCFRKHYLFTTTWLKPRICDATSSQRFSAQADPHLFMLSTALLLIEMQGFRSPIVVLTNLQLQFMYSLPKPLEKKPYSIIATYMKSSLLFLLRLATHRFALVETRHSCLAHKPLKLPASYSHRWPRPIPDGPNPANALRFFSSPSLFSLSLRSKTNSKGCFVR